jgi:Ca-activated chloride channel family protein
MRYSGPERVSSELRKTLSALELGGAKLKGRSSFKNRYQFALGAALLLLLIELSVMARPFGWRGFFGGPGGPSAPLAVLLLLGLTAAAPAGQAGKEARLGSGLYEKEEYDKALEHFSKAGELAPDDPRMKFNAGAALYRLDDHEKARDAFEGAAGDAKLRPRALYNKGNALFKSGDYAGAAESYKLAIMADPSDDNARHNLQKALEMKKIEQHGGGGKTDKDPPKDKKDDKKENGGGDDKDRREKQQPKGGGEKERKEREKRNADRLLELMKEKEKQSARPEVLNARNKPLSKSPASLKKKEKDW